MNNRATQNEMLAEPNGISLYWLFFQDSILRWDYSDFFFYIFPNNGFCHLSSYCHADTRPSGSVSGLRRFLSLTANAQMEKFCHT